MSYNKSQPTNPMKHISFVLPDAEREAFRYLCFVWQLTPSEALRLMVRIALGGGYADHIQKEGKR